MHKNITRREVLSCAIAGCAAASLLGGQSRVSAEDKKFSVPEGFKGDIKQSVSK